MRRRDKKRGGALLAVLAIFVVIAVVPFAQAAGSSSARAAKPTYNATTLRLSGTGAYGATGKSAKVTVTVCLQKRSGGDFINIRCNSAEDTDHSVRARVAVPGCIAGAWRTSSYGQATTLRGTTKLPAGAVSPIFHC